MPKTKHNGVPAVTKAAEQAGAQLTKLTGFSAVEAQAKKVLAAMGRDEGTGNFAEFHFRGANVQGIVKAGEVTLTINS